MVTGDLHCMERIRRAKRDPAAARRQVSFSPGYIGVPPRPRTDPVHAAAGSV